jgi:hypothetical protein
MALETPIRMQSANEASQHEPVHALLVFSGKTRLRWLRFLRPGFRHCFVVFCFGRLGIVLDPLFDRTVVLPVDPFDRKAFRDDLRRRGHTVFEIVVCEVPGRPDFLRPLTCCETIKRAVGLRASAVCTPWQLYRVAHKLRCADRETGLTGSR